MATAKVLPFMDSFKNFLAGFGGPKDKLMYQQPVLTLLTQEELVNLVSRRLDQPQDR